MLKPILLVEDNPKDLELTLIALERSQLANDVIVVGDSPQRRLFRDFISLSPLLAAPLIAILQ